MQDNPAPAQTDQTLSIYGMINSLLTSIDHINLLAGLFPPINSRSSWKITNPPDFFLDVILIYRKYPWKFQ